MLNEQIIEDAYIEMISGIGSWKNKREMWTKNKYDEDITIEFINNKVIARQYWSYVYEIISIENDEYCDGKLRFEEHYINNKLHKRAEYFYHNGELYSCNYILNNKAQYNVNSILFKLLWRFI